MWLNLTLVFYYVLLNINNFFFVHKHGLVILKHIHIYTWILVSYLTLVYVTKTVS